MGGVVSCGRGRTRDGIENLRHSIELLQNELGGVQVNLGAGEGPNEPVPSDNWFDLSPKSDDTHLRKMASSNLMSSNSVSLPLSYCKTNLAGFKSTLVLEKVQMNPCLDRQGLLPMPITDSAWVRRMGGVVSCGRGRTRDARAAAWASGVTPGSSKFFGPSGTRGLKIYAIQLSYCKTNLAGFKSTLPWRSRHGFIWTFSSTKVDLNPAKFVLQ
jgi:hypothetical protein